MALIETIAIKSLSNTVRPVIVQKYVTLSNGDNELVAAISGYQIQVMAMVLSSNLAGTFTLETGDDTICPFPLTAGPGLFRHAGSNSDRPLFAGNSGENLNMAVSSSPSVAGIYLQYRYKEI